MSATAADAGYPTQNDEAAAIRNEWSLQQQHDIFETDSTVSIVRVVDTEDRNRPVAIGRWHYCPKGSAHIDLEWAGFSPREDSSSFPLGMNAPIYKAMLDGIFNVCYSWTVDGPQWCKTALPLIQSLLTFVSDSFDQSEDSGAQAKTWGCFGASSMGSVHPTMYDT